MIAAITVVVMYSNRVTKGLLAISFLLESLVPTMVMIDEELHQRLFTASK